MVEAARPSAVIADRDTPRIGYATLDRDLKGPGDRRRFCYYASRRNLRFEVAQPSRSYDLVISSVGGDLGELSRLPRSTRLVLDLVDAYLAVPETDLKARLRGVVKFALGHTRRLHLNWRRVIEDTCRRADAVVCTTEEQKRRILELNPNVHVILDFHPEAGRRTKTDYARGRVFNLVWEGLPFNLPTFRPMLDALAEIRRRREIALHLVTDVESPVGSTHVWMRPTKKQVRELFGKDGVYLYEWNQEMLPVLCTACDLAVIPLPLEVPFFAGKPENKLILFWRMGLPVIASATPAYERAMRGAGLDMTCRTTADWVRMLERYMDDEAARAEAGRRGRAYAESAYGEASLLARWDAVLASVLE